MSALGHRLVMALRTQADILERLGDRRKAADLRHHATSVARAQSALDRAQQTEGRVRKRTAQR